MSRYELSDFSADELQDLMDQFWAEYGEDVDSVIDHVIRSCHHVVEPLTKNYYFDEDDLRAECRLAILKHAPWILKKDWLDSSLNPRGYFYIVARNRLIDLYKRYETRKRSGIACPQSFYDFHPSVDVDIDTEDMDALDFVDLSIEEDSAVDIVVRNNELSEMLVLLAKRLIYLERLASKHLSAEDWSRYMEWWNKLLEERL
jgi:DNA-directed RNA polymerase specialized sigma24 family protein